MMRGYFPEARSAATMSRMKSEGAGAAAALSWFVVLMFIRARRLANATTLIQPRKSKLTKRHPFHGTGVNVFHAGLEKPAGEYPVRIPPRPSPAQHQKVNAPPHETMPDTLYTFVDTQGGCRSATVSLHESPYGNTRSASWLESGPCLMPSASRSALPVVEPAKSAARARTTRQPHSICSATERLLHRHAPPRCGLRSVM